MRRVKPQESGSVMSVNGWLAGVEAKGLRVDTGADRTVVRTDFVPEEAYTGKSLVLDSWRGSQTSRHKVARIAIKVGSVEAVREVAVADTLECPALLGQDLGIPLKVEMMGIVMAQLKAAQPEEDESGEQSEVEVAAPVRGTRAQVISEQNRESADELASAQLECTPVPLSDILDFPDSYFESDPVPTPVAELCTWPEEGSVVDIPLPSLASDGSDRSKLVSEQQADKSLDKLMSLAEKSEKGYGFVDRVLVQEIFDSLGDSNQRVVVPNGMRQHVLELAHSSLVAGHFGFKKTFARISRHFLWPRMWGQVKEFVRSCAGCQRAARNSNAKAPLQPLPCVSEPFEKVAFDLVGPLPRTSSGNKYILTMMCLFTKYPEAIPLKRVNNETVLEAMMEIFSRHGLPKVILTDQGSVFMSKMTRHMCKTFEVHKVRTSPYHPQSDGALERWHACLKGMMKRSEIELKGWDMQLLFAYRDTPHCVTGFSPFTLLFGRDVKGPLGLLRGTWLDGESEEANVSEWLLSVKARMVELAEVVSDRERKAKSTMKRFYNKSAVVKTFVAGDMVLVRKPGIHSKMGDSWEGPYQIERQASPVTYKIQVPGKPLKSKILHCNMLKKWTTPAARIHRVVTMSEEESECEAPPGLRLVRDGFVPSVKEQARLDGVLSEYKDVLCPEPGRTKAIRLSINTGDHEPVRSHPYRIPPRWREEVKEQIDQLLGLGIIRPSDSPWSSSVVTVKKKDGGVRICIDFRAVNSITQPDPYQMPLIEEIFDMLASAKFISKIDLNKGFHQIPIEPRDIPKTAFCTPWGKFEFCVMPFGLRNGPAVFQRLMDRLLHRDKEMSQVYIDDIAVFSASWEEHCTCVARVLDRLREAGLTANVGKCQWGQTKCEFLGHVVGHGKVSPADLKVQAVREFKQPQSKKQIRQFLGLTGYYRRFVRDYAEHTFELTEATRKSSPDRVVWNKVMFDEFVYLKDVLCSLPSLTLPVPSDDFLLQTDASGVGLGAVLSVVRGEEELPVAFYSRKLQPRERRYSATELEGLAVVAAVGHFDAYLVTHLFTVETDHKALTFLNSANHTNGRLARWAMRLQMYTFQIRYRPGSQNVNADVFSRLMEEEEVPLPGPLVNPEGGEMS